MKLNKTQGLFLGVIAGVGYTYGYDIIVLRILWLLMFFFGGIIFPGIGFFLIFCYFLMWACMRVDRPYL